MFNAQTAARTMLLNHWRRTIRDAAITVTDPTGTERVGLAPGDNQREEIALLVKRPDFYTRTVASGTLGMGEAYMDGDFEVTAGGLDGFWTVLARNRAKQKSRLNPLFAFNYLGVLLHNRLRSQAANAQAHYDLGDDVYESFLGEAMQYSCGYATSPDDDLDTLQRNKLDRICQKLELKPGETLVDIGCGFGGLLIHAAKHYGIVGTGITNSKAHAALAQKRAEAQGVGDRLTILGGDFRELTGTYDKLVTVGMLEHVLESAYPALFGKIATLLRPGGLALVHSTCTNFTTNRHDPFIQKYIFPASNWPTLIQVTTETARQGLMLLDVENMARHYAITVRRWAENFAANRDTLDPSRYDERFKRMFEFYFGWGVAAASASDGGLYQFLLTNDHARDNRLVRI